MAKSRDNDVWISKQSIQKYQSLVSRQADKGGAYVDKAIDAYMRNYPDASVSQVRKFTYEMMQDALPNFTDLSEALSCEFMEEVAARHGWDDVHPEIVRSTDYRLVDKRLHYLAGYLADGDVEKYRAGVLDATRFYIMRAAQDSMIKNCDKAKLRYARVPSGFETCAFCFMLSSRGFVYKTERTAGENHDFHPNCNCTIVPGAKGRTRISGYDPQGMHDRWNACERTVGGDIQAKADWDALSQAERNAYIERHEDETHAFAQFKENRIMREVETRDWHWLYTGETPKVDVSEIDIQQLNSEQRHVYDKEYKCARVMSNNGFRTKLTDDPNAKPKPGIPKFDYAVSDAGVSWEAKCPEGNGYLAVAGNIAKADAKFRKKGEKSKVVLSNLDSAMTDKQFWGYFEESLCDPESDYSNVEEILFVFKDGTTKKWKK